MTLLEAIEGFYTPEFMAETYQTVVSNMNALLGERILPAVAEDVQQVKIYREGPVKGLTPPVAPGAESPITTGEDVNVQIFNPLYFREKRVVYGDDLVRLVNFKETPESEKSASRVLQKHMKNIGIKNRLRAEWVRWQAFLGNLVMNENGIIVNIDYDFPVTHFPTVVNAWSNLTLATPVEDLKAWIRLYEGTGYRANLVVMNELTADYMLSNPVVRDAIKQIPAVGQLEQFKRYFDITQQVEFIVYNEGYLDELGVYHKFVPDNKVSLFGKDNAMDDGIGQFTLTQSPYGPDIETLVSGFFSKMFEHSKDPVAASVVGGFYGMPSLNSKEAIIVADVS